MGHVPPVVRGRVVTTISSLSCHEVDDWITESVRFSGLFVNHECLVDIQVFGREEFEECRPVPATIAYPADKYGFVLYAKP